MMKIEALLTCDCNISVLMQVRLIKELYGNQIGELYHSLPFHMIEFILDDFDWSVHILLSICPLFFAFPHGVVCDYICLRCSAMLISVLLSVQPFYLLISPYC